MNLKPGASLKGVGWQMFYASIVVEQTYKRYGFAECTIVSGTDSKHKDGSLHYEGEALDYRIWHILRESLDRMAEEIRGRLGPDYDVVVEEDHLHIEYQPKEKS